MSAVLRRCLLNNRNLICNRVQLQDVSRTLRGPLTVPVRRITLAHSCWYSNELPKEQPPAQPRMPPLMDFPELMWPSALLTIKNWITVHFIIRPYFDNDFLMRDFMVGAKHALGVVSKRLSEGDVAGLQGLLSDQAIRDLEPVVKRLSLRERKELAVQPEDIYLSFPHQIGIMFDETTEKLQRRFVEITVVFQVFVGLAEMLQRGEKVPINVGLLPEYSNRIIVCNYRFVKEFTKGQQSDWTINIVNHFRPTDSLKDD